MLNKSYDIIRHLIDVRIGKTVKIDQENVQETKRFVPTP